MTRPLRKTRRLSDGCREGNHEACPFGPALCACACHKGQERKRTWPCPTCHGSGTQPFGSAKERAAGERRTCPRCHGTKVIPEGG